MEKRKKIPKSKISLSIDTSIVNKINEISGASAFSPSPSAIVNYMLRNSKKKFRKLRKKYVQSKEEEGDEN